MHKVSIVKVPRMFGQLSDCDMLEFEIEQIPAAVQILRALVDQVTLVPGANELAIVLRGDLAAILRLAVGKRTPELLPEPGVLNSLLSPGSVGAGKRKARSMRNGSQRRPFRAACADFASISGCGGSQPTPP
jgi:hypothetical protein